ncbi:L-2-hydroxyglutarate oxidase [Xylanimonas protaetiae]|uniref:L-2-hydroxyglutarate oxidase n=1 Tax=Xylanimonas protaetiae TaxID=2509457 RepID=A0A4V0YFV2_9MICO|nr:L-2-hydroxyglutarate oxidase [Xylanimonas protaetiae]QAY69001.1 L-2-hydroxyglutarate oxidase [Xylanimonas protaetiae]
MSKVVVVGAGIVGLATAARLAARGDDVVVVDKEDGVAAHQTGRNSGVVHSGLYYSPGSLKAQLGVAGSRSMVAFAREHGVAVDVCGKLVVATSEEEVLRLRALHERGTANGIDGLRLLAPEQAREIEPHVACAAALFVPATGIVDYRGVCDVLARQVRESGGEVRFGVRARAARDLPDGVELTVEDGEPLRADALVACAGLYADRFARASGVDPQARIVPFRGEYFELAPGAAGLVRGLVYPVPDPRFPFLGVHLTRMVHGGTHAGPNAVLALAREGYRWRDVVPADVLDALTWPGLWRLAQGNVGTGAREVVRSASRRVFARSLARLVPEITAADLVPAPAGVRAQALGRDGRLVDDFLVVTGPRQVHVVNAPSPAATASLEIARHLERQVDAALARA